MWWHILGVEADSDKAIVKKAYAKIIKKVDQDNDIDEFTRIHQAFRMAMKSFRHAEVAKVNEQIYSESSDDYIYFLNEIYLDETKRLNPKIWKDTFACMSFKEEESFKDKYIEFFNEHYLLIDEIWKLVDQQYPLSGQKSFKWADLYNGTFSISIDELVDIPKNKRCHYVKQKVSIYYKIMSKNYEKALLIIKEFLSEFNDKHICRWYMSVAMSLNSIEEIEKAYKLLLNNEETRYEAYYMKAGYLTSIGDYQESKSVISQISETNIFIDRINDENEQGLQAKEISSVNRLPWTELKNISKKKVKLLSSGNFTKAVKAENGSFLSFINKGGRD